MVNSLSAFLFIALLPRGILIFHTIPVTYLAYTVQVLLHCSCQLYSWDFLLGILQVVEVNCPERSVQQHRAPHTARRSLAR